MKLNLTFYCAIFLLLTITGSLSAETVILKSGKSFYGSVIEQNREFLKLKEKEGIILQFPRTDILKVTYKELNAKEVKKIVEVEIKKNLSSEKPETERKETSNSNFDTVIQSEDTMKHLSYGSQKKIRWGVAGRSAILPGLGQYHWDEPVWGSIYLISFLGAAINYHHAWNEHTNVKSEYQNDTRSLLFLSSGNAGFALHFIDKNNLASDYRTTANSLNTASDILIGIFLINLIDAFLPRENKTSSTPTSLDKKVGLHIKADMVYHDQNLFLARDQKNGMTSLEYRLGYTWAF